MNAFLKIRSNYQQMIIKNPLSNSLKFPLKNTFINQQNKKCSKIINNKEIQKGSLTNNIYKNTLKSNNNTKRTSELIEKIRNKEKLLNKLNVNKKPITIQTFLDKFNKSKNVKQPIKNYKVQKTYQNENINKENLIMNITEQNEDIFKQIQKVNNDIKKIETKMAKEKTEEIKVESNKKLNKETKKESAQFVEEYQDDIWETLINEQNNFLPKSDYMETIQKDITEKMRYILLDWLIELHLKYNLKPETFYLTVNIIDRYLSKVSVNRKYLQLLGISALFSASKYEDIYPPEAKNLVFMCDNAYKKNELIDMEVKVLKALNFDVTINSPLKYLDFFIIFLHLENYPKLKTFTQFLCELSYISYNMIKYNPCLIATSSLYISSFIFGKFDDGFFQQLFLKSQCNKDDVIDCAKNIISNLYKIKDNKYVAILNKYKKPKFFSVYSSSLWNSNGKFVYEKEILSK